MIGIGFWVMVAGLFYYKNNKHEDYDYGSGWVFLGLFIFGLGLLVEFKKII